MSAERILVVDDEEAISEIIASMLTYAGYQCRPVSNGLEALALLESGDKFELLLSDLANSPLDGFGLLEQMKEKFPNIPVVIVTAQHAVSSASKAIRNGAYDYILKPFDRDHLLTVVRRALESRQIVGSAT